MSNNYYLHKVKHELCLVNEIVPLGNDIYSISMPVILPVNKLNASEGKTILQRLVFQHLNSNSSKNIGFRRGRITLSSEPDNLQVHLMLHCNLEQLTEPTESEWVAALEKGLEKDFLEPPSASMGKDVYFDAWGIKNYVYDVIIEFWPIDDQPYTFECDCFVKYIVPQGESDTNLLDFSKPFHFEILNQRTNLFSPFIIKNESNPVFFLNDAEILDYEVTENDDGIGRELFAKMIIKR